MAQNHATKVHLLSVRHPDLLHAVDAMFDKFAVVREVQQMIEHRYNENVSATSIQNYKKKHWKVFKDMIRERKATMKGIGELIGEDGLTAGVNALLWQELQALSPTQLIAFKKVLNDSAKVALTRKQIDILVEEHRQKMKERVEAGKDAETEGEGDYERAQRVVQQVKEIFGIGMTDIEPPRPPLASAGKEAPPQDVPPAGPEAAKA